MDELILQSLNYQIIEVSNIKLVASKYVGHGMFLIELLTERKTITFLMPDIKALPVVWTSGELSDLSEIPTKENDCFHRTYNWPPLCRKT